MKANLPKTATKTQITSLLNAYKVKSLQALRSAIINDLEAPPEKRKCTTLGIEEHENAIYCCGALLFWGRMRQSIGDRVVYRKTDRDTWVQVAFNELTSGCQFKLTEADGTPVVDAYGHSSWIAASAPYNDGHGNPTIQVY